MSYESTVWLGSIAALCPSQDTTGDGTTTLTDFAGVGNGTLTDMDAATDWVTDDGKRCLDFDGSNDHVVTLQTPIGSAKCLSFAAKWRRLATTGNGFCTSISASLTSFSVGRLGFYHFSDGNIYIQFDNTSFGFFAQSLTDLNWHSLIVLFDGTATGNANRLRVWLDGVAKTLTFIGTIPAVCPTTSNLLFLGVTSNGTPIYGKSRIDDVRVNVRLWSDAERAEIDASRGGTYSESSGGTAGFTGIRGVSRRLGT
jgi:hypothetical protein